MHPTVARPLFNAHVLDLQRTRFPERKHRPRRRRPLLRRPAR